MFTSITSRAARLSAGAWLEAEDVLAMHLFTYALNGLLKSVLLEETQSSTAGGLRKQA